ncbi:MAG: hypothetical protein GX760_04125 [Erysipelothrix sp.]|nr:hypothetical protein [Erysipelothrix sp.]
MLNKIKNYLRYSYGFDLLSKHLYSLGLIFLLTAIVTRINIFRFVAVFVLIISMMRTLSHKRQARLRELALYTRMIRNTKVKFNILRLNLFDRQYKYIACKTCMKQMRVPRKQGNIVITCPNCQSKYETRS